MSKSNKTDGFTLVEVMVVLAIFAILTVLAMPSLSRIIATSQIRGFSNDLQTSILRARSEAMTRQQPVVVCPTVNGTECAMLTTDYQLGILAFMDLDGDGDLGGSDEILVQQLHRDINSVSVALSGAQSRFTFSPQGFLNRSLAFSITSNDDDLPEMRLCGERPGKTFVIMTNECPHEA